MFLLTLHRRALALTNNVRPYRSPCANTRMVTVGRWSLAGRRSVAIAATERTIPRLQNL